MDYVAVRVMWHWQIKHKGSAESAIIVPDVLHPDKYLVLRSLIHVQYSANQASASSYPVKNM